MNGKFHSLLWWWHGWRSFLSFKFEIKRSSNKNTWSWANKYIFIWNTFKLIRNRIGYVIYIYDFRSHQTATNNDNKITNKNNTNCGKVLNFECDVVEHSQRDREMENVNKIWSIISSKNNFYFYMLYIPS